MAILVRMPSVLAGATEAAINKWLVAEGAEVIEGQPLVELETEKAVVEYNAEVSGTMGKYVIAEGKSASIGDPICVVLAAGESVDAVAAALGDAPAAAPSAPAAAAPAAPATVAAPVVVPAAAAPVAAAPAATAPAAASASTHGERLFASPLARKMAREAGLDLATVAGSGPDNRIVRVDVEKAIAANGGAKAPVAAPSPAASTAAAPAAPGQVVEVPLTGMRKAIARRLVESKQTIPHFYLVADCKVDRLIELRKQVNETEGVKVSLNDFVVLATAKAFVDVPEANVTWGETVAYQHSSVDISIAVSTEGGLVTPVLRNAANLSLTQLSATIKDLAERGRNKRLQQHELEGGSFSISNLGMYGTEEFAAIINPPQSGILAVGAAKEQPVVENGIVKAATVMRVTLSADHRAIDGALAAQWLAAFVKRIENPVSLLV
jgi:pyruvate dehydrogenase E2 component (dihydrolipoamide acetyltransferase)